MGRIRPQTAAYRRQRALSAVGLPIRYRLGRGGFLPRAPRPDATGFSTSPSGIDWKFGGECDCSGFVAWALVMQRHQVAARKWWSSFLTWIETTQIYRDATGKQRVVVRLKEPEVGCLVVYGDVGRKDGHIGIVTEVDGDRIKVVDCASGPSRKTGSAINHGWDRGDIFLRNKRTIFCCLKEDLD